MTTETQTASKRPPSLREPAGLYVHVPFCTGKCPYCDFYSVPDPARSSEWAGAVLREAGLLGAGFEGFDSLYLGGGTPSLLPFQTLEGLLEGLRRRLPFFADTEVTLEVNPEDVRREALSTWLDLGIDRISLGVQSLNPEDLAVLGRRHSASCALGALEQTLEAGFRSVSVDLIYGLPGNGLDGWTKTLETVVRCAPHHISCYELTVHARTPLGRDVAGGRVRLPDEQDTAACYLATARVLEAGGYAHYEVSNFAQPGHACRHNRKYWRRAPYLGLGPGAHSFLAATRWWNPSCLATWLERLGRDLPPAEGSEDLTPEQDLLERLWLGFRTSEGLAWDAVADLEGADRIAGQLERSGLVTRDPGRMIPTTRGYLVSDGLPLLFAA